MGKDGEAALVLGVVVRLKALDEFLGVFRTEIVQHGLDIRHVICCDFFRVMHHASEHGHGDVGDAGCSKRVLLVFSWDEPQVSWRTLENQGSVPDSNRGSRVTSRVLEFRSAVAQCARAVEGFGMLPVHCCKSAFRVSCHRLFPRDFFNVVDGDRTCDLSRKFRGIFRTRWVVGIVG